MNTIIRLTAHSLVNEAFGVVGYFSDPVALAAARAAWGPKWLLTEHEIELDTVFCREAVTHDPRAAFVLSTQPATLGGINPQRSVGTKEWP